MNRRSTSDRASVGSIMQVKARSRVVAKGSARPPARGRAMAGGRVRRQFGSTAFTFGLRTRFDDHRQTSNQCELPVAVIRTATPSSSFPTSAGRKLSAHYPHSLSTMPRRPPPSALLLSKGPTPARGHPKFTLPAKPQRVLIPTKTSPSSHLDGVMQRCLSQPRIELGPLHPPAPTMAKHRQLSVSGDAPPQILEPAQQSFLW
ncbi:hypothetical protein CALVIDRAFT_384731 [Calocera viscosa TUFC12733]|uniref:Uncharacterized protein n=1 Tax=Calocera viscosa (strain TUFC12733) TaxID=1330018 RepID=A0A167Q8B8_CALVF|nr:hypothetical protein CALVIDRAFT_384731 [Calocera viscosa TUFC12733]